MFQHSLFAFIGMRVIHYFKEGSSYIKFYDVIKKEKTKKKIDRKIPVGCMTIGIDNYTTFIIGGGMPNGDRLKLNWEFKSG